MLQMVPIGPIPANPQSCKVLLFTFELELVRKSPMVDGIISNCSGMFAPNLHGVVVLRAKKFVLQLSMYIDATGGSFNIQVFPRFAVRTGISLTLTDKPMNSHTLREAAHPCTHTRRRLFPLRSGIWLRWHPHSLIA